MSVFSLCSQTLTFKTLPFWMLKSCYCLFIWLSFQILLFITQLWITQITLVLTGIDIVFMSGMLPGRLFLIWGILLHLLSTSEFQLELVCISALKGSGETSVICMDIFSYFSLDHFPYEFLSCTNKIHLSSLRSNPEKLVKGLWLWRSYPWQNNEPSGWPLTYWTSKKICKNISRN